MVASNDQAKIPSYLIGSKLREAINDCFQHHQKVAPNQSSRDAVIGINGYYHNKHLMISLDTSFESLHKRGFRVEGHPAPLHPPLLSESCFHLKDYSLDSTLYACFDLFVDLRIQDLNFSFLLYRNQPWRKR